MRKQKPDFWVDFIISILKLFGDNWDYVIIPDTRFPNEIGRFQLNWFDVSHLRVVRPGFRSALTEEQLRHPSETALDDVTPDYLLVNDGTMEDLERKIDDYLEENIYG